MTINAQASLLPSASCAARCLPCISIAKPKSSTSSSCRAGDDSDGGVMAHALALAFADAVGLSPMKTPHIHPSCIYVSPPPTPHLISLRTHPRLSLLFRPIILRVYDRRASLSVCPPWSAT